MPIHVPVGYLSLIDEETSRFVVVMEDLGSMRIIDQNIGMTIEDARKSVDAVAKMHANWWGKGDALAEAGKTVSLGDPIYPAVLPFVFGEGWAKLTSEMSLPKAILEIGPHFSEALPKLLSSMVVGPNTLCHGDYRADNLLFNENNELVAIDFQLLGTGTGAYDIAYFVTQSLTPEVASKHERDLFDQWVTALITHGAPAGLVDRDTLWLHYRTAALFCLAYPVIASRGMDLSDPRQRTLIEVMTNRFDRAVRELNLAELL
jgi:aminoglycoside/choline kinase family phosphotransferase